MCNNASVSFYVDGIYIPICIYSIQGHDKSAPFTKSHQSCALSYVKTLQHYGQITLPGHQISSLFSLALRGPSELLIQIVFQFFTIPPVSILI